MPPTTPSPTTTYRPAPRPVPPPAAKKNTGLLAGLGVSAALALIGIGFSVVLLNTKSAQQGVIAQHETAASALATTLGVTVAAETNAPVNWTAAWDNIAKSAAAQKAQLAEAQANLTAAQEDAVKLQAQIAEVTAAKVSGDKQVGALKQSNEELTSLKTQNAAKIEALNKELADTKAALTKAQGDVAALTIQLNAAGGAAVETAEATAGAAAVGAAAGAAAVVVASEEAGKEPAEGDVSNSVKTHVFAAGTTKVMKKIYEDLSAGIMKVELNDGTQLVYRNIPAGVFDSIIGAPVPDTYFRLKVVGNYACTPDDKAALRALKIK